MLARIYPLLLEMRKLKPKESHILPKVTEVVSENRSKTRFKTRRPQSHSLTQASFWKVLLAWLRLLTGLFSSPQPPPLQHPLAPISPGSELFTHSWPSPMTFQLDHILHSCALPRPHGKLALPQENPVLTYIFYNAVSSAQTFFFSIFTRQNPPPFQRISSDATFFIFKCNSFISAP